MAMRKRRSVVLHFDLNRTVLMSDAAGGRTMENTVNYLLSECTWGYVNPSRPCEWICVSDVASIDPPVAPTTNQPLITYKQFVDETYPYQSLTTATACDIDQIKTVNKAAKKKRTALQSAFTAGPGARVRSSFENVMQKLHFPAGKQRETAKQLASMMSPSRLQEAWREGRYYLLPSFLHFVAYLASPQVPEPEFDVKLVFRTFGDDIPDVAREFDLFIEGKHPLGLPALPERFRLKVEPGTRQIGTFYRDGYGPEGTVLALGTLTKVPFSCKVIEEQGTSAPTNFYKDYAPEVKVIRGFQSIHEVLNELLQHETTLALRDYWEWWSAHAEDGEYGKLLLIEKRARADDNVVVFFDDHIEAQKPHIVDVRDVHSGTPVDFETARDMYLQRVEPFAAITDTSYFTSLFQKHVNKQKHQHSK